MDATSKVPNTAVHDFKRTKIIATIGPVTNNYEAILSLLKAGANGIRLNFSHGTYEEREQQIKWIRDAAKEYGKPVAIIADLQGPKVRLGDFEGEISIKKGQHVTFKYQADYERSGYLPTQYDLSKKAKRTERIYLFDGKIRLTVTSVAGGLVHATAENAGVITKRKGINLPDTDFSGDVITDKDKKDIAFISSQDIDYVAQSFIQSADDVIKIRKILSNYNSDAKIIGKIETKLAIDNLDEIVDYSDVVMVARGDLAIESSAEAVPVLQRKIVALGRRYATPVIIATQMLASMTDSPEPTRAEVSDVATAVITGADCVMLSDETATGSYPKEAVAVLKRVILYTQANSPAKPVFQNFTEESFGRQDAICMSVVSLANNLNATAIVAETATGNTPLQISSHRPDIPIIAVTASTRVAQQLALAHGTKSYMRPVDKYAATKLTNWLKQNKVLNKGDIIVTASGMHPGVVGTTDTIKVRVLE